MEFASEFARQMEDMLREMATTLESSGDAASASDPKSSEEADRLKSPFAEKIVERTTNALSDLVEGKTTAEELGDTFQTRLNAAMAHLHRSDTNLQVSCNCWLMCWKGLISPSRRPTHQKIQTKI